MKNVIGIVVLVALGVVGYFFSSGGSSAGAVAYNDRIISLQSRIVKSMIDFSKSFDTDDKNAMEKKHAQLLSTIQSAIKEAQTIEGFDGNTQFRDAAVEMFKFYDSIAKKEYKEIMDILKKETPEETDLTRINEIVTSISQREEQLDRKFQVIQQAFARKHNIMLMDNKMQKQIDNL
jgi:hypothetical protein